MLSACFDVLRVKNNMLQSIGKKGQFILNLDLRSFYLI